MIPLFRFVAVRRPASRKELSAPPQDLLDKAFDFTGIEIDRTHAHKPLPAATLVRKVHQRAAIDEHLSLADVRSAIGERNPPYADLARHAVAWAVWRRSDSAWTILRGLAVIRLSLSPLDGEYLVRELVRGQRIRLPRPRPAEPAAQKEALTRTRPAPDLDLDLTPVVNDSVIVAAPTSLPPPSLPVFEAQARVLGRGDLMVVRSSHLRYDIGEIAYVENVLKSELRGRTHVVDTATGQRVVESDSTLSESTQELSGTERHELQEAASSTNTSSSSISAGMSVSGGFGPVKVGIDVNASHSTSTSESNSSAASYAKEVTDRATETMRTSSSQRTVTTTRTRVTETNKHDFDNTAGAEHVRGVYRWLNKVDLAQVYNYGERLMLEFVVPEPAAQHVYLASEAAAAAGPVEPGPLDFGPDDVTERNFMRLGGRYQAAGLSRPPAAQVSVPATFTFAPAQPTEQVNPDPENSPPVMFANAVASAEVSIPDGYAAGTVVTSVVYGGELAVGEKPGPDDVPKSVFNQAPVNISAGGQRFSIVAGDSEESHVIPLEQRRTGNLPIAIGSQQVNGLAIAMRVIAFRTDEAMNQWQHDTFTRIQQAYLSRLAEYETAQSVAQMRQGFTAVTPTDVNRSIEIRELTRSCQTLLTGQEFDLFGSISTPLDDAPRIDLDEAWVEADAIQFFSDVFEWDLITYVFYPYQWAGRHRWAELSARTSSDPLHQSFLQAGAARVVVPVRPGYERHIARYLRTGKIPEWGPEPWRGRPTRHPAVDELIADANDRPSGEVPVAEPWEVISPTSLIYLQADAELNP